MVGFQILTIPVRTFTKGGKFKLLLSFFNVRPEAWYSDCQLNTEHVWLHQCHQFLQYFILNQQ